MLYRCYVWCVYVVIPVYGRDTNKDRFLVILVMGKSIQYGLDYVLFWMVG